MSNRVKAYCLFLAAVILFIAPYLTVFGIGTMWMWRHGLIWLWAIGTGLPTLIGLALMERARRIIFPSAVAFSPAAPTATSAGKEAMESVRAISRRMQDLNLPLDQPEVLEKAFREAFLEVLETVARHYHPQSDRPALETPVAHVASLVELVAADFRRTFSGSVPWGKTVTLGRLLWWKEKGNLAWRISMYLWQLNRLRRMFMRPATAIVQEVQDRFGQNMTVKSFDGLKQSAIDFCIMKAGEYAVELYSGGFVRDEERRPRLSPLVESLPFDQEPLQILVVGQVKAGKSSLINGLQGEMRAPVDTLPATEVVDLYECQPDGLPPLILRDTPGYGAVEGTFDAFSGLRPEIEECDLLLIVGSARSAARKADRELLLKVREFFQRAPHRMLPPFLYVLTHIDAVPAHLAAEARSAVAADFGVSPAYVVPICGKWGRLSNIDGVAAAIQSVLPEAERQKIGRCIRQIRKEQDENEIIRQVLHGLRLAGGWAVRKR